MLAIFIFSIAAVSASDVNDTAIASGDDSQIELSASDEITEGNIQTNENILTQISADETVSASNELDVLGGTYADLHYEIYNGGTTVELQHDYYTYDGTPVTIGITDDNRIIDGKGAVIDMAGAPSSIRIFDIDASRVTIKNLTIINVNFIDCGGAILFNPGSSGTVENCNFINNTASDGSAICFMGSTCTVRNCNFTNNSCWSYGGAIAFSGFGSTGTVTDCNFAYNSAKYGGAIAFAYNSTGTVTNCNFTNNNTADYGGAFYFSSSGNVTNCNFINGSSYYGGAVFWIGNDGRISDCNFTGNTAIRRGGAVHWGDTETESESQSDYTKAKNGIITRSNFINNTAAQGGAVFWFANDGKITDNCYFKDNNATGEGGAVYWKGKNGYISNKCTFTDNEAIIYAGAIFWQGDDGTLTDNCRFINNSAYTQGADGIYRGGGAIFWMGNNANVSDNCSFINNTADTSEGSGFLDSYRGGGAIYIPGAESHVTDCIFTGNFATHYGGAVYAVGGNSVVDRCSFENNSANMGGAAFTAASDYSYLSNCIFMNNYGIDFSSNGGAVNFKNYENSLSNCTFKDNYAENCGGAVYWQNDGGDVFNCSFENNSAYTSGGALYMEYGGTISYCDFVNNYVTGWASTAGAVYIYSASSIKNCNFTNNTAIKNGGAVFFQNKGELTDCNFKDNKASNDGGAVYFNSNGNVTNCNFTNNNATGTDSWGGAIMFVSDGTVTKCNFTGNTATRDGGAIRFTIRGTVIKCNFTNNTVSQRGGAIFFSESASSGTVEDCNFTNNHAISGSGGAVCFYVYSTGIVKNCNFINNSASDSGAIRFIREATVKNCNFTNNTARLGGAIRFETGTVENCNFTNNHATITSGSAVYCEDANVTNCTFTDNSAHKYGGAIYCLNQGTVEDCNFTNNTASGDGGAVYFLNTGTVTNCNFTNNKATGTGNYDGGGAVYFYSAGSVTNCNFTGNTATVDGGAVYFWDQGTVTNCTFTNNSARYGGAVEFDGTGTVSNCNFTGNTASINGGAVYFYQGTGTVSNCNFINNNATANGGAVYFNRNGEVTNCNFANNNATGTDSWGGAIMFVSDGTVTNCNFTGNTATTGSAIYFYKYYSSDTLTVSDSTFLNNRANTEALDVVKNDNNITITFTGRNNLLNAIYSNAEVTFTNVKYWGATGITTVSAKLSGSNKAAGQKITVGVVVNNELVLNEVNVTDENGMIVLDINAGENYYISARHDADSYYTEAEKTISNNTKFNANVTSQTTTNKTVNITAKSNIYSEVMPGKLLFILPNGDTINATYASNGTWWAVHTFDDYGDYQVNASYIGLDNVTITNATISIVKANSTVNVSDVVMDYGDSINVTVTAEGAKGINATIDNKPVTVINNYTIMIPDLAAGNYTLTVTTIADDDYKSVNKTVNVTVNKAHTEITINTTSLELIVGDETIINATLTPAGAGNVTFTSSNVDIVEVDNQGNVIAQGKGQAIITVSYAGNNNYTAAENKTITVTVSLNDASVTVDKNTSDLKVGETYAINATKHPDTILLDITYTSSNTSVASVDKNGVVTAVGEGTAIITVSVGDGEIYAENSTNVTVTVSKVPTEITASDVTATYNINKDLVITLKDSTGKALTGVKVSVDLNGAKEYTTDNNGQVKVSTKGLAPKTYTVKIAFNGNTKYAKSVKEVKVTVKKATPKITAKKKTFKATTKTMKYTITLKDNTGKAIKKAKVTLKVKGKTYKATTNSKGKATFKITKLNKKGTYKATVTYKGNKYYNKATKKVKITVKGKKSTFKTVSKGSKDTKTVKKIQRALKDNGYYLTYQGHYLKIDGKYDSCTVRSVKEFQNDKGLKVTGKVDQKTAKKLGII